MAAAAVAGAVAIGAAPAAYAVANLGHSLNGNNVLAGPASVSQGGFGGGGRAGCAAASPAGRPRATSRRAAPRRAARPPPGGFSPPGGGFGGGGGDVSDSMLSYLEAHQGSAKYLLAASGSQTTAPIIIKTGKAVVTIGGFSGQDNAPTVSQLQSLVSKGELKYVLLGGRGGDALAGWVQQHGKAVSGYSDLYAVSV